VRRQLLAAVVAMVAVIAIAQPGSSARGQDGGILRINLSPGMGVTDLDPALSYSPAGWALLDATCARLYTYPDARSPRGFPLRPEVAAGHTVSKDLKTYTFTLRRGFRFDNGERVRASAFAHAINRVLHPAVKSPGVYFMRDIVGADDVLAGRADEAQGVVARGNTLVVRFERPAPNFLARTTLPFFCAVPPWLPVSAEGIDDIPSAGPYVVQDFRPKETITIRRNRLYGGERSVHLDGFDVNLRGGNPVELLRGIERGDADWGLMPAGVYMTPGLDFEAKYGRNKTRFWMLPGLTVRMLLFNPSRPLFRNNPRLRQAVNFAFDRRAQVAASYGPVVSTATEQLIPPAVPGFRDADVYPLKGNLDRAKQLARGHLRHGKAVLVVADNSLEREVAQIVKHQLASIGLEVEIEPRSGHLATAPFLAELTRPGAARRADWDMVFVLWTPSVPDAHEYLSLVLEVQRRWGETLTRAHSGRARAALARAARMPTGRARNLAYAEVDALIARDIAPVAVLSVLKEATLVSERVGCKVLRPALDLAVACLRE
jgi:ABC-type transport system substrate-binding protein